MNQPCNQRKMVYLRHPLTECPSADYTCQPADHYGGFPPKFLYNSMSNRRGEVGQRYYTAINDVVQQPSVLYLTSRLSEVRALREHIFSKGLLQRDAMALIGCQISQKSRFDSECRNIYHSHKQQAGPVSSVIRIRDFHSFVWLVL